jgi:hypothetical protein
MGKSLEVWLNVHGAEAHINAFRRHGYEHLWQVIEGRLTEDELKENLEVRAMKCRKVLKISLLKLAESHSDPRSAEAAFMAQQNSSSLDTTTTSEDVIIPASEIVTAEEPLQYEDAHISHDLTGGEESTDVFLREN